MDILVRNRNFVIEILLAKNRNFSKNINFDQKWNNIIRFRLNIFSRQKVFFLIEDFFMESILYASYIMSHN